jgi:hypothetical protein
MLKQDHYVSLKSRSPALLLQSSQSSRNSGKCGLELCVRQVNKQLLNFDSDDPLLLVEQFEQVRSQVVQVCSLIKIVHVAYHEVYKPDPDPNHFQDRVVQHGLGHKLDKRVAVLSKQCHLLGWQRLNNKRDLVANLLLALPVLPCVLFTLQPLHQFYWDHPVDQ